MGIDQDPYFRLLRENAHKMKNPSPKPALIHSKFLTALQGAGGKMSSSEPNSAIFMSDTKKDIQKKINKYAFSGGGATVEEHRERGGNPDVDVPYQYLSYFLEDDEELKRIYDTYKKGDMLTGEIKKICIDMMQKYVADYQEGRKEVTDELLEQYMTPRRLEWKGNPNPVKKAAASADAKAQVDGPGESKGEKPERPTLAPRGKSYGIKGLKSFSGKMSAMIYGDDEEE